MKVSYFLIIFYTCRHGDLSYLGSKVSYLASKTREGTDILKNELIKLEPVLEEISKQQKEIRVISSDCCNNIIQDPIKVRSKGMHENGSSKGPKTKRKCGLCKNYGHTRLTCLKRNRMRGRVSGHTNNVQELPPKKKPKL